MSADSTSHDSKQYFRIPNLLAEFTDVKGQL